jgi:hypothetical protein
MFFSLLSGEGEDAAVLVVVENTKRANLRDFGTNTSGLYLPYYVTETMIMTALDYLAHVYCRSQLSKDNSTRSSLISPSGYDCDSHDCSEMGEACVNLRVGVRKI